MPARYYRLTVVVCALAWFMVGLHAPALHNMIDHGRTPDRTVLAVVSLLAVVALASLWALLRARASWTKPSGPGAAT